MLSRRRRPAVWPLLVSWGATTVLWGCASPASPRPPSLHLPEPVQDVQAVRSGEQVELRFALPRRTTDGELLHGPMQGSLCRMESAGDPCQPVPLTAAEASFAAAQHGGSGTVVWVNALPAVLTSGPPRSLGYRITVRNSDGRTAGPSNTVYAAAGTAPAPVAGFTAEGERPGILMRWVGRPTAESGTEVLVKRTQVYPVPGGSKPGVAAPKTVDPDDAAATQTRKGKRSKAHVSSPAHRTNSSAAAEPGTEWLRAGMQGTAAAMVDNSVQEGTTYRYEAIRQVTAKVGGRTLTLQSALSAPVEVTWKDVYPPAAPQNLVALGYRTGGAQDSKGTVAGAGSGYAVDLVWQPVEDARVTGYVVTRQGVNMEGTAEGPVVTLTAAPVVTPGYHDVTPQADQGYRYSVVAVDAKGNRSAAAIALVAAQPR